MPLKKRTSIMVDQRLLDLFEGWRGKYRLGLSEAIELAILRATQSTTKEYLGMLAQYHKWDIENNTNVSPVDKSSAGEGVEKDGGGPGFSEADKKAIQGLPKKQPVRGSARGRKSG